MRAKQILVMKAQASVVVVQQCRETSLDTKAAVGNDEIASSCLADLQSYLVTLSPCRMLKDRCKGPQLHATS